jgi:hypothetical protein
MAPFISPRKKADRRAGKPSHSLRSRLRLEELESRLVPYALSGSAWPSPQLVTISFMPDGTSVNGHTSNLFATFNAKFGSAAAWENQILKAAQTWAQQTNVNFAVVSDSGAASGSGSSQQGNPSFGDIRIGGYNFGTSTIAQAFLPPPANNYSVAGDIQLNTGQPFNVGSTYDLYTVALHEIGHALGLYHTTTTSAVLYPTYSGVKTGLAGDDISGIQAIYGGARAADVYKSAISSSSAAAVITSAINTTSKAGVVNSLNLTSSSSSEWFKFVAPSGSSATLTVQAQSQGLSLLDPYVQIYSSSLGLLASGNAGSYGGTATATYKGIAAGQTYYVKVYSTDPLAAFQTGAYALVLNMGTGANPTLTYPATQKANGSPLQSGGGQALILTPADNLVNTTTTAIQQTGSAGQRNVATDSQGNYVVTWASAGQDGSGWGVYAQRYSATGAPLGGEFRVNTTTLSDQTSPSVAMDANGDFVVVWQSNAEDGSGWGIYGQRYSSSGAAQGGEFRINVTTAGDQTSPSVAMSTTGDFVVAWASASQDGSGLGVYARRYSASGAAQGSEFRVNTTTAGDQTAPSVAMGIAGDFVVAWQSSGQDGSGWGIYAQRYSASGAAQGGEFRINTTTAGDQVSPSVAVDLSGNFAVAWASYGQDAAKSWGIYERAYNVFGTALGGEVLVNTTTAGDQVGPSASFDAGGNVLVTWASSGQDGSGWGVYGQILQPTGARVDGEFRVNTTTTGDQQYASVAVSRSGQAVVVWSGYGPGDSNGVFSQRLDLSRDNLDPPTPVQEVEPNDTLDQAQDLGSLSGTGPVVVQGNVGNGATGTADVDWFQFSLAVAATVDLHATAPAGSTLQSVLTLYNDDPFTATDPESASGHRVLAQSSAAAGDADVQLALSAGTYWVAVSGAGDNWFNPYLAGSGYAGSTGDYELTLQATDLPADVSSTPTVLASSPANRAVLDASPLIVRVDTSAPLDLGATQLIFSPTGDLAGTDARPVTLASVSFSIAANELQLVPAAPLAPGSYGVLLADGSTALVVQFQVAGVEGGTAADDTAATAHDLGDVTAAGLVQVTGAIGDDPTYDPASDNPLLTNPADDVDLYHFQVSGPGRYVFGAEVFAGRIGSTLDPGVSLYRLDPATRQLDFIDGNDNTLNSTLASNGTAPLYNDALLYAALTAGDYYVAVSAGGNTPVLAVGALPGQDGIFDPNVSHSGSNGDTVGNYVLNLLVQPDDEPPQVVAVTPPDGASLDAPPTQLTVQFSESMNLQEMAYRAFLTTSDMTVSPVFIEGDDGARYYPRLQVYDDAAHTARFLMLDALPAGTYQLHLAGGLGLTDLAGNPLAGNDPSGDFVAAFTIGGPARGTAGDPLLWSDQEPNDTVAAPQDLGVLFPHELQAGVTVARDFTAAPASAPADTADYYRFAVLQGETYVFILNGTDLPDDVALSLLDASGNPVPATLSFGEAILAQLDPGTYEVGVSGWTADTAATLAYQLDIGIGASGDNPPPLTIGPAPALRLRLAGSASPLTTGPGEPIVVPPVGDGTLIAPPGAGSIVPAAFTTTTSQQTGLAIPLGELLRLGSTTVGGLSGADGIDGRPGERLGVLNPFALDVGIRPLGFPVLALPGGSGGAAPDNGGGEAPPSAGALARLYPEMRRFGEDAQPPSRDGIVAAGFATEESEPPATPAALPRLYPELRRFWDAQAVVPSFVGEKESAAAPLPGQAAGEAGEEPGGAYGLVVLTAASFAAGGCAALLFTRRKRQDSPGRGNPT